MPKKKRNYREEYDDYHASEEQKMRRAQRNSARRKAIREGRVRKGDSKELDHVGYNRRGSLANVPTRVVSRTTNRRRQPKRS